jgi:hypothetical protein
MSSRPPPAPGGRGAPISNLFIPRRHTGMRHRQVRIYQLRMARQSPPPHGGITVVNNLRPPKPGQSTNGRAGAVSAGGRQRVDRFRNAGVGPGWSRSRAALPCQRHSAGGPCSPANAPGHRHGPAAMSRRGLPQRYFVRGRGVRPHAGLRTRAHSPLLSQRHAEAVTGRRAPEQPRSSPTCAVSPAPRCCSRLGGLEGAGVINRQVGRAFAAPWRAHGNAHRGASTSRATIMFTIVMSQLADPTRHCEPPPRAPSMGWPARGRSTGSLFLDFERDAGSPRLHEPEALRRTPRDVRSPPASRRSCGR